ncbi:MAG: branched-chain amino acid ABC transporter permease [Acidimicrobiales bacterium]
MDIVTILLDGLRAGVGPNAAIFALLAIGLNIHYGYTGLNNFGQVGFMMVGAYGTSIAVVTWGWSLWISIPFGLVAAAGFALLLGIPTLRLRSDYFAITTIAAAEIIRFLIRSPASTDLTGGPFGLQGAAGAFRDINPYPESWAIRWRNFNFANPDLWLLTVAWITVIVITILLARLTSSPWGRVLRSIREDEDAARSLGKNVVGYKMQALVLGGMIGALGGVVDVLQTGGAVPEGFRAETTFFAYAALILGGAASRLGPVVGAMLFWFMRIGIESMVRDVSERSWPPDFLTDFLAGREGLISITCMGIMLVLLMVYRPQGLLGNREEVVLDAR